MSEYNDANNDVCVVSNISKDKFKAFLCSSVLVRLCRLEKLEHLFPLFQELKILSNLLSQLKLNFKFVYNYFIQLLDLKNLYRSCDLSQKSLIV